MHDRAIGRDQPQPDDPSRRAFLGGLAGVVGLGVATSGGWTPAGRIVAGSAAATMPGPPGLPAGVHAYEQAYRNWSGEIRSEGMWTCAPRSATDVVALANWASAHGWKLRPRGAMHGWTPLTIRNGARLGRVLLVDTTQHLRAISVAVGGSSTVSCGAGATLGEILQALEDHGLGWTCVPAPGVLTIAGALAVGAHGAALPAHGEVGQRGSTYGSLSNLVTALTAVVWDDATNRFVLRTFERRDPQITAILTSLGRTFLTSVTLQASANLRLRCQSTTGVPIHELFAPPGAHGRTFAAYVAAAGRVEAIWFPFTDHPWLKVWTPTPSRPRSAKLVTTPYNYSFSDTLPLSAADALERMTLADPGGTPAWGQFQLSTVRKGLDAKGRADLWGWSKNTLLYIRPTTLRMSEGGGAVITSRANIQRVVHEFTTWYGARLDHHRAVGHFPVNGPVEIRCCGLDQPDDVLVESAGPPTISALRPRPDHAEWDTAVWLNVLAIPGTPGMWDFYREMEQWMVRNYSGSYASFRPEWSKGWAFTTSGPYTDPERIGRTIPDTYRVGYPAGDDWDSARAQLDELDPRRVFTNPFIDQLLA